MFQVSIFCIFERSIVLLDLFENHYLDLYSFENRIVLIVTNLLNFQYSFHRKSKKKPHWAWRDGRYFIIKSYHSVSMFRATVEVLQMTWQPCSSLFLFFHTLHFWEEHGTVKVISNFSLELHIVEDRIALMFTNSLNFLSKENRKKAKIELGDMKGDWAWRHEKHFI